MAIIHEAKKLLSDAETSLRGLIEKALREQRYGDVREMVDLADGLSRILGGERPASASVPGTSPPLVNESPRPGVSKTSRAKSKPEKPKYPYFLRDGDRLVKVGWSKKNKDAYEHRVPREAVNAFTRHLLGSVGDGKLFVLESLFPVPDIANGGEIPAYQVYVTLAWLRQSGVIDKKGRDGYVLRHRSLANGELDKLWAELPNKSY